MVNWIAKGAALFLYMLIIIGTYIHNAAKFYPKASSSSATR